MTNKKRKKLTSTVSYLRVFVALELKFFRLINEVKLKIHEYITELVNK